MALARPRVSVTLPGATAMEPACPRFLASLRSNGPATQQGCSTEAGNDSVLFRTDPASPCRTWRRNSIPSGSLISGSALRCGIDVTLRPILLLMRPHRSNARSAVWFIDREQAPSGRYRWASDECAQSRPEPSVGTRSGLITRTTRRAVVASPAPQVSRYGHAPAQDREAGTIAELPRRSAALGTGAVSILSVRNRAADGAAGR